MTTSLSDPSMRSNDSGRTHALFATSSSGQWIQNTDFRWALKIAFNIYREESPTLLFHDATRRERNSEVKSPVR